MMRKLLAMVLLAVALTGSACADTPTAPTSPTGTPVISLFTADSVRFSLLTVGATTLRWEVTDPQALVRIDPFPGNVPYVGSAQFVPSVTGSYSFTLNATNSKGTTQRFVTIVVTP